VTALRLALALLVAAAASCGAKSSGPAWPKSADSAVDPDDPASDGGESLEPRNAGSVASIEASSEPDAAPAVDAAKADAPKPDGADKPATDAKPAADAAPTDTSATEPPIEGEIVIEITD
jgi:hypothetical protein